MATAEPPFIIFTVTISIAYPSCDRLSMRLATRQRNSLARSVARLTLIQYLRERRMQIVAEESADAIASGVHAFRPAVIAIGIYHRQYRDRTRSIRVIAGTIMAASGRGSHPARLGDKKKEGTTRVYRPIWTTRRRMTR